MTDTATEHAALSADALMTVLFGDPGPHGRYLRVVVRGAASTSEIYCRHLTGRWAEVGAHQSGKEPGLADAIAQYRWGRLMFSPILRVAADPSALAPITCLAVAWPLPLAQAPPEHVDSTRPAAHPAISRILEASRPARCLDHASRGRVLALIESTAPLKPHVILDEGDRLVAL